MNILRDHFRPSQNEIWRQLSDQMHGIFVRNDVREITKIQVHHKQWTITLDSYSELIGENTETFTRMRAPYVNKDGFRFSIHRTGFFNKLENLFGIKDIEIGEPRFDGAFIIQGNDESKVRQLFSDQRVRHLIEQQPIIYLSVCHDGGWFESQFPDGVDELYFRVPGVITDFEQLKSLYELFAEVLSDLCDIGSAYEKDPGIVL
jgi:hypothetical protein